MNNSGNLRGHSAIISGALGDIGTAIARELARRGANVALGDVLEASKAQGLLDELKSFGVEAHYDYVDVSDDEQVRKWFERVEGAWGAPDLIVPNAAIVTLADARQLTAQQWRREMAVNLDGAFFMAQNGALRLLSGGKPGRIVFIGSWAAHAPHAHIPAYAVAKAGLRMLMKCLALDLAPHDILVNEVAPGYVNAGLSGHIFAQDPVLRAQSTAKVPVQLLIEAEDVALQVAHLCDPANRHMTGGVLLMDGGLSLLSVS